MVAPLLRVPASGYGGSGYKDLFGTGGTVVGVTTALGALDKGGIVQWSVDQTIGYMLANKDDIYNRTTDQAFGYLRWYHKRFKESDYDDPNVDIRNAHVGVLNDLADNGTAVHEWIEAYWTGGFEPDLYRPEQVQMVEAFLDWEADHEIEVHATELTVFGDGYAGTSDLYVTVDGVPMLVDAKSARAVRDSHGAQLAALGAADYAVERVFEYEEGARAYKDMWFRQRDIPAFNTYGVLQFRPDDDDKPRFCQLHVIPQEQIDVAFDLFMAAKNARLATKKLATLRKG